MLRFRFLLFSLGDKVINPRAALSEGFVLFDEHVDCIGNRFLRGLLQALGS